MGKRDRKRIKAVVLMLVLCLCLAGCGSENNSSNSGADNFSGNKTGSVELTFEEIVKLANRSGSPWEMLAYLFPDYAIYRDADDGYILEPVREYLKKNEYDWTNKSAALFGIDVSQHQGNIDWEKVKASGVKFVFIRVGYRGYVNGTIVKDEYFEANIQGAISSGIPVGVYFATKARNVNEAREEAEWIIEQIRPYNVTWPVVMDFEIQNETDRVANLDIDTRTEIAKTACDTIKAAGYTPMIYGYAEMFIAKLDYTKLDDYSKWFAQYMNAPHYPYAFQIWQASEDGTVDGIEGAVDINYSMIDFAR